MKHEYIIFLVDSLRELNETYLSFIQLFAEDNTILVIPSSSVVSLKTFLSERIYKEYVRFLLAPHANIHLFFPVGLFPFPRIPLVSFLNNLILLPLLSHKLNLLRKKNLINRKKPIVYICGSEKMFNLHWIYIPGIFNETVVLYDLSQTRYKTKLSEKNISVYERKIQDYADVIFVINNTDKKFLTRYKNKVRIFPDASKDKRDMVNKTVKSFFS